MRLLVVDRCSLMQWVVQRLAPADVEVEQATTIDEAMAILRDRPPQAVIFNLTPESFPWAEIERLCRRQQPPISTVYLSCVHEDSTEAGIPVGSENFFVKPLSTTDLRQQILRLTNATESATE
ncbi:MAG: hypothetical protein GY856_21080 [bacterium]|nr:hypothetical protein [bacterium]